MKYDKQLKIATGTGRTTVKWVNRTTTWSKLEKRLSETTRTAETVAEYKAMPKARQAEIKDTGGFVGGYCKNGKRSDTVSRSVVTLDADFGDMAIWEDWQLLFGNAAAIYSTHKHTPQAPRLRLVIPLDRDVTPDEYQAIGRRIADALGIDKFDDTTYQPQRVMYWPSTSRDGEYVFESLDAPFISADAQLATYTDWQDVTSWPISSRQASPVTVNGKTQQDPTEKKGLVGAFCRAYSIEDAIEDFVPEYTPCDGGRYTYAEGSTAGGVITYDGKFSYSHHGTDPASLQLCNAWDLVRIHRFRELDEDCSPDAPISTRPSYKAMQDFARELERVRIQLTNDQIAEAAEAVGEFDILPDDEKDDEWKGRLSKTKAGANEQTIANFVLILKNDKNLRGIIALNEMTCAPTITSKPPWDAKIGARWSDTDDSQLRLYMERFYGLSGREKLQDALNTVAADNKFHPVRDYLNGLTWDGIERLDSLLIDYLGAENTGYTRAVTRKTLTAAVARVMRPGCKFDYMLTLRGKQGLGKSTLIARLGGKWYSDSFIAVQGKEAFDQLQGVWIMEVGELAGMKKAEAEQIKNFISKRTDAYRRAYARNQEEYPRQCIFIATTNEREFLRDTTGNRRFWVIDTPNAAQKSVFDLTDDDIGQIWAEAVQSFKNGEKLYLSEKLEAVARSVQSSFEEDDPRAGIISAYLDRKLPENWAEMDRVDRKFWLESDAEGMEQRDQVCTMELWCEALGNKRDQMRRVDSLELGRIMDGVSGWGRVGKKIRRPYGQQQTWERKAT